MAPGLAPMLLLWKGPGLAKTAGSSPVAVIAAIPQDLKFQGEYSNVYIGDGTTIREFVTINRGTKDREKTVIGSNCLIMAYCHFAHDCFVGDNCITSNNTQVAGHVTIGDWAIIGGMCAVHQFVKIGFPFLYKWWIAGGQRCAALYQSRPHPAQLCRGKLHRIETPWVQCGTHQSYPGYLPGII